MLALELSLFFVAGVVQDALGALYVRSIADRCRLRASLLAGAINMLYYSVIAVVLARGALDEVGAGLLAFALGCAVGTWLGLASRGCQPAAADRKSASPAQVAPSVPIAADGSSPGSGARVASPPPPTASVVGASRTFRPAGDPRRCAGRGGARSRRGRRHLDCGRIGAANDLARDRAV